MADASQVSRAAASATASINQTLKVGSPGDQMEALLRAYRLTHDREAFVMALVGELVGASRRRV